MRRYALPIILTLIAAPAFAQSNAALDDRLDRLERDLNFVQKQVYTGGGSGSGGGSAVSAQTEVRLSQMAEEIRQLRGQIEQAQYDARKAQQDLQKIMGDVDYRLQTLEQKASAMTAMPVEPVDHSTPPTGETIIPPELPSEPATYQRDTVVKEVPPETPVATSAPTGRDFPNSNAHYSYAFKLLNEKNYSASAASFDSFVKKYPSDPLVGNAYYWLGESYYARGDYTRAAEGFRKGFEANPNSQKAPDNLLKLAMSLGKVKRVSEACIVLKQVQSKYGQSSPRTATRAVEETANLRCK